MEGDVPVLGFLIFLGVIAAFFAYVEATRQHDAPNPAEKK